MDEFEEFYLSYKKEIYYFLLKLSYYDDNVAQDLTQETFYQAFRCFERFRGECKIETWLCQIAKNLYYKQRRKEDRDKSSQ